MCEEAVLVVKYFDYETPIMQVIGTLCLTALLFSSTGCMSLSAIHAAKRDSSGMSPGDGTAPRPGYYFLLPLTVPLDIGTLPHQGIGLLMIGPYTC
jgi:hypothetical protein